MRVFSWLRLTTLLAPLAACVPPAPATREGFGIPVPSFAAARAIADSIGAGRIIVVDTLVLFQEEPFPTEREITRVRVLRGRASSCRSAETRASTHCPTIIWVETLRPQWMPP